MLKRTLETLDRWATGRNILLLVGLYVAMVGAILPLAQARLQAASGGVGPLDLRLSYTPAEADAALRAYGDVGRHFYLLVELTLDVLYPVVYALFLSLTLTYCFRLVLPAEHGLLRVALLPLATMIVDYLENAGLVTLLVNYPRSLPAIAAVASVLTTVKWTLAIASLTAVVVGLAAVVVKRVRSRGPAKA